MKLRATAEEYYPVLVPADVGQPDAEMELSQQEWEFVQRAMQDFDKAQDILKQAYRKAYPQDDAFPP